MEKVTRRVVFLSLGWIFFALGFIGIAIPGLPTTPFMILALGCFSKGSETIHHWLYNHPRFGPSLQDWDKYRMIPVKAKITAITMMAISAAYLVLLSGLDNYIIILVVGFMVIGAVYVLTKPSRPNPPKEEPAPKAEQEDQRTAFGVTDSQMGQTHSDVTE